jgi:hypothetical protein
MTTVGYGDLSGYTTTERIYCIILMIFGVLCFTFVSGALSSIMASSDQTNAYLEERLLNLHKLKSSYKI